MWREPAESRPRSGSRLTQVSLPGGGAKCSHPLQEGGGVEAPALSRGCFLPISFYFFKILFHSKSSVFSPFCFPEAFLVNS